jgi:hypothetical protein
MSFDEIESMSHKEKNKMEQDFSGVVAEKIPENVQIAKVRGSCALTVSSCCKEVVCLPS